jgi:hypothetical protein
MGHDVGVTPLRWYILTIFSLVSFFQGLSWVIPGPVAVNTAALYGFSAYATSLLVNWGPIIFIPLSLPMAWLTGA